MADKPVRADKATAVAELTDRFRASSATLLTEYRGLTVAQLKELRRNLGRETTYAVAKNTLAKRAAIDADEVRKLADLESREVLLAKLAGAMKANLSKAAATFQAPLTQLARLAQALQDKRGGAGAETGASDETTAAAAE